MIISHFLLALTAGLFIGNLGEYWAHRMQHLGIVKVGPHQKHHTQNKPRPGWLYEYWGYLRPSLFVMVPVSCVLYLTITTEVAVGWFIGVLISIAITAYVHELTHVNPHLIFWLKQPIHHTHHTYEQTTYNFGVTHALWDKLFGTYRDDPSWKQSQKQTYKSGAFLIRWF